MTALPAVIQAHRRAVEEFLAAARRVPEARWGEPCAPGKWSPGQVVEHVTLAYEVNRGVLQGAPPPTSAPRWVRPLIRRILLAPVLRRGRFIPGSRAPRLLRPGEVPSAPGPLLDRFDEAVRAFEVDARAFGDTTLDHPCFGRLSVTDFVRLQEIHTRHHYRQLVPPTAGDRPA